MTGPELHPYLQTHPHAVQDIEKAHLMAKHGDTYETNAAGVRYIAREALNNMSTFDEFENAIDEVKIPKHYEDVKALTDLDHEGANYSVDNLVGTIDYWQAEADATYDFVSETHDKLKATER